MRRNINIAAMKHIPLFLLFLFLALCFNNTLGYAQANEPNTEQGNALAGETLKRVEDVMVQQEKRKKALAELVRKPLTEAQQQLLHQLLQHTGTLDEILSSAPYLAYLKAEVGKAYKDFPAYVEAMPTPKQKIAVLFSFKKMLPPKTKAEAISIGTDYYFKLRSLLVKEPDVVVDMNALIGFQTKHLMDPLMAIYPITELAAHMSELTQMAMVTNLEAQMSTEVFHDVWREWLEKHGSSEGLLRCAIATPAEFALVRSCFEDTAAFEKWIQTSLKAEDNSEKKGEVINR
ncbi:hypothetical protein C6499_13465 [Candidatus Poribacteria bacterium]|nr:MAG: hypothetical protein C6499_13465 [Candidatus Poribacteria bacterium]